MSTLCAARTITWSLALVLYGGQTLGATIRQAEPDSVDQWVTHYMEAKHVPRLALGVLQGGHLVKAQGYGLANLEQRTPVTPETVFESASAGKQFTAAAILLLVQDGKLRLDDAIAKYLPPRPTRGGSVRTTFRDKRAGEHARETGGGVVLWRYAHFVKRQPCLGDSL